MKSIIKRIVGLGGIGLMAAFSTQVQASGYKLEFQSPSVLADAGDAAVVEDVGTNWYNSAGLVYLPRQITVSSIEMNQRTHFNGTVFAPNIFNDNFFERGGVTSHNTVALPAMHAGYPINNCWAVGMSVVPAWGLLENYGENAFTRYNLTRVYTRTLDLAPSISWRINNWFSIGAGPDFDYWAIQQRNHIRTQPLTLNDSRSRISTESWAYGGHIGALYRYDDCTRFGINFRSRITHNLKGYSTFDLRDIASFETSKFRVSIPHPASTSASFYHDMNPRWAMMGTLTYDQWSAIDNLAGRNYIQPPNIFNPTGLINVTIPQNYHNTFDMSLGTHYKLNDRWLLRGSIKYEQTPTMARTRDINFPDGEKLGLNLGARYQFTNCIALDMIVAHVFTRQVRIDNTSVVTGVVTRGHMDTRIDLAGAQLVWDV